MDVCVPCTVAKAKQKNISVQRDETPAPDGKARVYLDISSIHVRIYDEILSE